MSAAAPKNKQQTITKYNKTSYNVCSGCRHPACHATLLTALTTPVPAGRYRDSKKKQKQKTAPTKTNNQQQQKQQEKKEQKNPSRWLTLRTVATDRLSVSGPCKNLQLRPTTCGGKGQDNMKKRRY